jgi:hypothetical protein
MDFTRMGAASYTDKKGNIKAIIVSRHNDFNVVTAHHTSEKLNPQQIIQAFGREHLHEVETVKNTHNGQKN